MEEQNIPTPEKDPLVQADEESIYLRKQDAYHKPGGFFDFGRLDIRWLCELIFWCAILISLLAAIALGYTIYQTTTYERAISYPDEYNPGMTWYSSETAPNLPAAVIGGLVAFAVSIFVWKLVCEMLFIVLRYFHHNTRAQAEQNQE